MVNVSTRFDVSGANGFEDIKGGAKIICKSRDSGCTRFRDKFHFYRASICEGGLGSPNSVRQSVRLSHAWIVTKLNDALQLF